MRTFWLFCYEILDFLFQHDDSDTIPVGEGKHYLITARLEWKCRSPTCPPLISCMEGGISLLLLTWSSLTRGHGSYNFQAGIQFCRSTWPSLTPMDRQGLLLHLRNGGQGFPFIFWDRNEVGGLEFFPWCCLSRTVPLIRKKKSTLLAASSFLVLWLGRLGFSGALSPPHPTPVFLKCQPLEHPVQNIYGKIRLREPPCNSLGPKFPN